MHRTFLLLFLALPFAYGACPAGTFRRGDGECVPCPYDTYNDQINATSCKKCPGFTESTGSASRSDCVDCPPGKLLKDGMCETCPPGTYNPFVNAKKCIACPKGTFSNTYNPSYCSPCRAGRVTKEKGTDVCKKCSGNRYQPWIGQKNCILCPAGTVANPDGASCKPTCYPREEGCKICPKGKELNKENGKCVPCPEGMVNPFPSVTKCQPCPDALMKPFIIPTVLVPNKARTKCVCKPGESLNLGEPFPPTKLNPVCSTCPDGMTSNGVKCMK